MAISVRIDLSGQICIEKGCTQLLFSDTTGFLVSECADEQNDLGYGLTGGIALNDVTAAKLNIYYPNITTPVTFDFTIATHVITECIFTDLNGLQTDITSLLESTVFPLFEFDVTLEDYDVTLPDLSDGIINWDYTISGTSGADEFSYTTSDGQLSDCTVNCCIENKYIALDPTCDCIDDKIKTIMMAEIFLNAARYSMNVGQDDKTNDFIAKANELCNSNCEDC